MVRGPSKHTGSADGNEGGEAAKVGNITVERTSDRATEERGTIIELTVQHKARWGVIRASLVMVRSWVVVMRKCGYKRDHDKQCT